MATVFQRGTAWVAQWYRPDGSRAKRTTGKDTKREAKREAERFEAEDRERGTDKGKGFQEVLRRASLDAQNGHLTLAKAEEYLADLRRIGDPSFGRATVQNHIDGWLVEVGKRVTANTARIYAQALGQFTGAMGTTAGKPLADLSRGQIEAALHKLRSGRVRREEDTAPEKLRASTANLALRVLRQSLRAAVNDGKISRNPCEGIRPLDETDSVPREPFTPNEVQRMMTHADTPNEWAGLILFSAHTGLRLRDAVGLHAKHIEGADLVITPAKTARKKKTVTIPLTPPLLTWIKGKKGAFFPTLSAMSSPALSGRFSRIMAKAGVPRTVDLPGGNKASRSFHSLRHSFASWLAEADIHADVRKRLTGHSDDRTHARYTHHDESLRRAIQTLPDLTGTD